MGTGGPGLLLLPSVPLVATPPPALLIVPFSLILASGALHVLFPLPGLPPPPGDHLLGEGLPPTPSAGGLGHSSVS